MTTIENTWASSPHPPTARVRRADRTAMSEFSYEYMTHVERHIDIGATRTCRSGSWR